MREDCRSLQLWTQRGLVGDRRRSPGRSDSFLEEAERSQDLLRIREFSRGAGTAALPADWEFLAKLCTRWKSLIKCQEDTTGAGLCGLHVIFPAFPGHSHLALGLPA